jgi:UDP-N-acetylmuramoyl-L-alanyl-D-glutamate--2,6-diaminopimelate ligase
MISCKSLASLAVCTEIINELGSLLFNYELELDSRKINSNSIFCAYPGSNNDGRNYIENAIHNGVKAILYEFMPQIKISTIPNIAVQNLMLYVGLLAAHKYNNPSTQFYTIGVTGTNGKTSVTHWLNQIYSKLGQKIAIIGTTGSGIYSHINLLAKDNYARTTPDPVTLQKLLANFVKDKIDMLAMEVSSHSLHQGRVNGIAFKSAIFTNLTQDHLDYHKTMEAYYQSKRDLFYWHGLEQAIINVDDEYGNRLYEELKRDIAVYQYSLKILTYGIKNGDLRANNLSICMSGMSFVIEYKNQSLPVKVKIIGQFNVYNILSMVACLLASGYQLAQIVPLLSELNPVSGRMDTIMEEKSPLIVIDYAHTPDALLNTLNTLKNIEHRGKLYCVFGCGGNRDMLKRPIMGKIATEIADHTFITSDNPRDEDPVKIIEDIVATVSNNNYTIIVDRALAITQAIKQALPDDIVLIAGKGHETYQEIKGIKYNFSDFEMAKSILKSWK